MDLELRNKVVFVAGASRGIGFGIARAFLAEGARVAITGRNAAVLESAEVQLRDLFPHEKLCAVSGDMTSTSDLTTALGRTEDALGRIDIVIANVGGGSTAVGYRFDDAQWDATIQENLTGSVRLMREAMKRFMARPDAERAGCNVVAVSSIAGVDAMGSLLAYASSKAALNHFVKNLAKEVGRHGIRVNAIAPGNILFPGGDWEKAVAAQPKVMDWIKRDVALRRFGTIEEIADAVLFVASPRAAFMTGECLVVDGGQVK
jgi:3-oxoacyl-[acyl-carrier protein] reductase